MADLEKVALKVINDNAHSGVFGTINIGDGKARETVIDLEIFNAVNLLGQNRADQATRDAIKEFATIGQDGKGFQNSQIGLIDPDSREVDSELVALITMAAENTEDGNDAPIQLVGLGNGTVSVSLKGAADEAEILTFEGDALNAIIADLSDIPAVCDLLPTTVGLNNEKSEIAAMTFDTGSEQYKHGSDQNVDSQDVKDMLIGAGNQMSVDEAVDLTKYGLSADGQADTGIHVDFNGTAVIVSVDVREDKTTDTFIFKGDAYFETLADGDGSSVSFGGKASQIGLFDFTDDDATYTVDRLRDVLDGFGNGSQLSEAKAIGLIQQAFEGDDRATYLGGNSDSAIISVDGPQGQTDLLFLTGVDDLNFI